MVGFEDSAEGLLQWVQLQNQLTFYQKHELTLRYVRSIHINVN